MGTGTVEREYLYWLSRMPGLGAVRLQKLRAYAGGFEKAYYIEETELKEHKLLPPSADYGGWKRELCRLREELAGLEEQGIRFITPLEEEYPQRLRHIYDYPMGLYVKGDLPREDSPTAAIIGARGCTSYGRQAAAYMGRALAEHGVQIISGLALGIDGAGHEGALAGGGRTFAVLGCGVNICYPRTHYPLYERIQGKGGILSEYGPGTEPLARNFPIRNRIISGLSDVILVMEARKSSGSLITAEVGLEQGKDIFALPGRMTDALSEGCNCLIQAGAAILLSPEDVLNSLGIIYKTRGEGAEKTRKGLAKNEKMVYSCLDSEPIHLEQAAQKSGLSVSQCMSALLELELKGLAVRTAGLYYVKKLE